MKDWHKLNAVIAIIIVIMVVVLGAILLGALLDTEMATYEGEFVKMEYSSGGLFHLDSALITLDNTTIRCKVENGFGVISMTQGYRYRITLADDILKKIEEIG